MRRLVIFQLALVACSSSSSGINVWGHQWCANHSPCHGHQFKPTATPGCSQSNLVADLCFRSLFFGSTNCCLSVCRLGIDSGHFVIDLLHWSHATWPILLFSTSYVSCNAFEMLLDFDFFCKSAGSFMYFLWWCCTITDVCMCTTLSANTAESSMYFLWQYCRIIDVLAAQILQDHWCTKSA